MDVIIENTAFNVDHWARFSEADFALNCRRMGLFSEYEDKEGMVKTAYNAVIRASKKTTDV